MRSDFDDLWDRLRNAQAEVRDRQREEAPYVPLSQFLTPRRPRRERKLNKLEWQFTLALWLLGILVAPVVLVLLPLATLPLLVWLGGRLRFSVIHERRV